MIGALDRDDVFPDVWVLAAYKAGKLVFRLRGSDHQDFTYAGQGLDDIRKKLMI
jgi:hypothetical protein